MKIKLLKKRTRAWTKFTKREWARVDIANFGFPTKWNSREIYMLAYGSSHRIKGALKMKIKGGMSYVSQLIIASSSRGKGVGGMLMEEAEQIAKKAGCHKIYLDTGESWPAVKFYKSLGYKITGTLKNHYFHADFVIMSKFLRVQRRSGKYLGAKTRTTVLNAQTPQKIL